MGGFATRTAAMTQGKSRKSTLDAQTEPVSFESAVSELESLVNAMDSQSTGLDQLLTDYKRGALLVKYCRDRLAQVRKEVVEIEQTLINPVVDGEQ